MSKFHCIDLGYDHDYDLIGIHSVLEDYRMAFYLNRHFKIGLNRLKDDLDFDNSNCSFSAYAYEDETNYTSWALISNKFVSVEEVSTTPTNLFPEETKVAHLIPEKSKVDYFVKITGLKDDELKQLLSEMNDINQIITSYTIDPNDLRSRDNLIF